MGTRDHRITLETLETLDPQKAKIEEAAQLLGLAACYLLDAIDGELPEDEARDLLAQITNWSPLPNPSPTKAPNP